MPEFNPIISTDLSGGATPSENIHVPSIADPKNYQPQYVPENYGANVPEEDDKPSMSGADIFSQLMQKNAPTKQVYDEIPFNQKAAERYKNGPFNPEVNNEDVYGKNQGILAQMGNATAKFAVGAGVAFAETLMSIPDMLSAIGTKKLSNTYENRVSSVMEDFQNNMENVLPNYYTDEEKAHPFKSAIPFHSGFTNFLFDKLFKGSGLVVGTLAGAVVENAVIGVATEGIGNIAVAGEEGVTIGSNMARWFGRRSLQVSKLATNGTKFQAYVKDAKMTGDLLKNATKLEEYAAGVKVLTGMQYGLTVASSSNMMAAQGARETYKSIQQDLKDQFVKEHGYAASSPEDLQAIETTSIAAANTKYGIDFALFTLQNAIAFPNAMKGFKNAENGLKTGIEAATKEQVGKIGIEGEVKVATDIDKLKLTPESGRERLFRKWVRPQNVLTQAGVMGLAHGSGEFTKNYYTHTDLNDTHNLLASALDGFTASFGSQAGLEAVLLGGLTGLLIGPVEHEFADRAAKKAGALSPEAASKTALENLKKNSITGLFVDNYKAVATALSHAKDMQEAVKEGNIFKYKNLQADQFADMVLTGIKSNRHEVVREQLKMMKDLPESELDKLMNTPADSESSLMDKHAYIDELINNADKIKKDHDAVSKVFLNKFQYRPNAKDEQGKEMNEAYLAYETLKDELVKSTYAVKDREQRLKDIDRATRIIHPDLSADLAAKLCSILGLEDLQKEYEEKSADLRREREELGNAKDSFTRDRYDEIRRERGVLNAHIDAIQSFLEGSKGNGYTLQEHANLFQSLASFEMNSRDIDRSEINIPLPDIYGDDKGVGGLIDKGLDINEIRNDKSLIEQNQKNLYTEQGAREFLAHKIMENKLITSIKKQEKENNPDPIQVGEKQYEPGRTYKLQEGYEIPKVEEGTDKGLSRFFTKDFWGGVGAKKKFTTEQEAQESAEADKKAIDRDLSSVTVIGKELDKNGNIKVKTATGRVYDLDPALLENHIPSETPDEIVTALDRAKLNEDFKKHNDEIATQNPGVGSINNNTDELTPDQIKEMKAEDIMKNGKLKSNPFVFGSTITPPDWSSREYAKRTQTFFTNFNEVVKDITKKGRGRETSQVRMILVHSDNAKSLGLDSIWTKPDGTKGSIIDYLNQGTSKEEVVASGDAKRIAYDQSNPDQRTIASVVVEWDPIKKERHFIDFKGNRVIDVKNTDDLVFAVMPTPYEDSVQTQKSRFRPNVSEEKKAELTKAWKLEREQIFANSSTTPQMYSFDVSRGFPKRTRDEKDPTNWKQNPVVGSLVEKDDLYELGLATVVTENAVTHMGENIPAASGNVILKKGNRLQFLNNRKLSDNEKENIFQILKDFTKTFEGIRSISFDTKDEGERKKREQLKGRLTEITNFLQGTIFYGRSNDPKAQSADFKVGKRQLYIKGDYILLGENQAGKPLQFPFTYGTFDETNPNNKIAEFKEALNDLWTNANSKLLASNEPFRELYTEKNADNKIVHKSREWKSYQHYLLSDKYDLTGTEGKEERHIDEVPFRTSVNMKTDGTSNFEGQYAALKNSETGKYMFEDKERVKEAPKPEIKADTNEKVFTHPLLSTVLGTSFRYTKEGEKTLINEEDLSTGFKNLAASPAKEAIYQFLQVEGLLKPEEIAQPQKIKEALGKYLSYQASLVKEHATSPVSDAIVKEEVKKAEEKKPEEAPTTLRKPRTPRARMMNPQEAFVAYNDIGKSEAWFEANIPVPGERMKTLIQNTGGGFSWGRYVGTHVEWYENARKGTIEHEGFEAVWASFTSAEDRATYRKEFRGRTGEFIHHEDGRTIKYSEATDYELKERLAEELGHYILDDKSYKAPKSTHSNVIVRMFQDFVSFVKGLFNGSIKKYFDKINTGYYKTMPALEDFRGEENSKVAIGDMNSSDSYSVVRGVTSRIIQHLFADAKSLIEFDVKKFDAGDLYEKVRLDVMDSFINANDVAPEDWREDSTQSLFESGQITREQYEQQMYLWNNINNHWASEKHLPEEQRRGSVIDTVSEYLKVFGIRHDAEEGNEEQSASQFGDVFAVDNNKSMSASMKLLFATIVEQTRTKDGEVVEKIDPRTNMPVPVMFNKLVNFTRSELVNLNTFAEKINHLTELAQDNPNLQKVLDRLAVSKRTEELTLDDLKLQSAFNNTFGKQRPDAIAQYVHEDGNVNFSAQNLNASTLVTVSTWLDGLKLTAGEAGSPIQESKKEGEEGQYVFDGSAFKEAGRLKLSARDGSEEAKQEAIDNQIKFLNALNIPFTAELRDRLSSEKQANQAESDLDKFTSATRKLYEYIQDKKVNEVTAGAIGEAGRLKTLAELYLKASGEAESTFYNIENKQQSQDVGPNYVKVITNNINEAESKEELLQVLPHLNDAFRRDSVYLNRLLFDGNTRLRNKRLSLDYIQGKIDNRAGEHNITVPGMSHPQRLMFEINANLSKIYYVLVPADSKTEWTQRMDHIIDWKSFHEATVDQKTYDIFNQYYKTEKGIATETMQDGHTRINDKYKSLMYEVAGGYEGAELDPAKLKEHIEERAKGLFDYLLKTGIIEKKGTDSYRIENFNSDFAKAEGMMSKGKPENFSEEGLKKLFKFTETNYMINNVEMHKLFFGDVAKVKDPLKRYKSFMSPRETSMYESPEFNNVLDKKLNQTITGKADKLDKTIILKSGDYGWRHYSDNIKTVVTRDQDVYEGSVVDDKHLNKRLQDAYKHVNPTDGSGFVVISAHREIMYKRGQVTRDHDSMYDFILAQDRKMMFEDGVLQNKDENAKNYYRPELQEYDERRVKAGYKGDATLDVLKPIYSGVDQQGNLLLDKYSLAPLSYALVRKGPMRELYMHMVDMGIHYSVADSGRKIGADQFHDVYAKDGTLNTARPDQRTLNVLNFKYFGIQTETGGRHHHNSFGTQMSTEVALNSINRGVPTDYVGKENWSKLSLNDKRSASEKFNNLYHNHEVLRAMQEHGYDQFLKMFGIEDNGEKFSIPTEHMPLIENLLKEELLRRDASQNVKDGLSFNKETGEWNIPLEAISNYKQIKQILFAYVDKMIAKPKQNGGAKIMVPGIVIGKVGGKDVKTVTTKNGKETRLVSDGLKFYEAKYDKDGKRTSVARMEVMITSDVPRMMREHARWTNATDEEIMEHLNTAEGSKVLEGIGFRIPTQEMNSLEAFTIKGFLPDYLGDTVVVPESITTKAGSDFDVDKLQTYVKNIYLDKEGNVKLVPWHGTGDGAIEKFREIAKSLKAKEQPISDTEIEMLSEELDTEEAVNMTSDEDKIEKLTQKLYKQSLQNEYYDSLGKMILDPENFERLIKPNSADMLKGISKMLEGLAKNEFTADKKGSVLDRMFMSEARHAFITGKDGVSIAANNQKNHSLNQLTKVVIDDLLKGRVPLLEQVFLKDGKILLPHNEDKVDYTYNKGPYGQLEKVPFEQGRVLPTFSGVLDSKGNVISDNLSQGIDGYVDVAKGAWIMNIIQNPMTSSTYFTMMKMGIDPETAALFINQPIIREFVKMLAKDNSTFMLKRVDSQERRELEKMFPLDVSSNDKKAKREWSGKVSKLIDARMKEGFDVKTLAEDLKSNIQEFYGESGKLATKEKNLMQHAILQEFLKYTVISSHLFSMQEALTWDTKSMAEPNMQARKQKLVDKAREAIIISDVDDVLRASHLGGLMKLVGMSSDAANQAVFKIAEKFTEGLAEWSPRDYVRRVLGLFPDRISSEDYQRTAQAVEEQFISFLVQNHQVNELSQAINGGKVGGPFNERVSELLVDKKTSIAKRIKDLRKDLAKDPNNDISTNEFFKRLVIKTKNNAGDIKNIFMSSKPTDPFSIDVITAAMREFRDSPIGLKYNDLYNDICIATFLQSGLSNSDISFAKFIPSEDYAKLVAPAIKSLETSQDLMEAFVRTDDFFRNKWKDSRIVPQAVEKYYRNYNEHQQVELAEDSKNRLPISVLKKFTELREAADEAWSEAYAERTAPKSGNKYRPFKDYTPFQIAPDSEHGQFDFVSFQSENKAVINGKAIDADYPGSELGPKYLLKKLRRATGEPVMKDGYYIYIPISTRGDGRLAEEHYADNRRSVLKTDGYQVAQEIPIDRIIETIDEAYDDIEAERQASVKAIDPTTGEYLDNSGKSSTFVPEQDPQEVEGNLDELRSKHEPLPEAWKKSGKTEKFQIAQDNGPKTEVEGYRLSFEGHPNLELFVYKRKTADWIVSDAKSGMSIGSGGKTIKEAVANASTKVNENLHNTEVMDQIGMSRKNVEVSHEELTKMYETSQLKLHSPFSYFKAKADEFISTMSQAGKSKEEIINKIKECL